MLDAALQEDLLARLGQDLELILGLPQPACQGRPRELLSLGEGAVTFRWKDYRQEPAQKRMRLEVHEFIRRFLLHTLPKGLQRIRHYKLLSNRHRATKLAHCRELTNIPVPAVLPRLRALDYRDRYERLTGQSLYRCAVCERGEFMYVAIFSAATYPRSVVPRILHEARFGRGAGNGQAYGFFSET